MLHEISFKIVNIYSISGQNRASVLLWHKAIPGVV